MACGRDRKSSSWLVFGVLLGCGVGPLGYRKAFADAGIAPNCQRDCRDWQRWRRAIRQLQEMEPQPFACPPCEGIDAALADAETELKAAIAARQRRQAVAVAARESERAEQDAAKAEAKRPRPAQRSSKR